MHSPGAFRWDPKANSVSHSPRRPKAVVASREKAFERLLSALIRLGRNDNHGLEKLREKRQVEAACIANGVPGAIGASP